MAHYDHRRSSSENAFYSWPGAPPHVIRGVIAGNAVHVECELPTRAGDFSPLPWNSGARVTTGPQNVTVERGHHPRSSAPAHRKWGIPGCRAERIARPTTITGSTSPAVTPYCGVPARTVDRSSMANAAPGGTPWLGKRVPSPCPDRRRAGGLRGRLAVLLPCRGARLARTAPPGAVLPSGVRRSAGRARAGGAAGRAARCRGALRGVRRGRQPVAIGAGLPGGRRVRRSRGRTSGGKSLGWWATSDPR